MASSHPKLCVVIPVHKTTISASEKKSLQVCCEILKHEDLYLVAPLSLNIDEYLKICDRLKICHVPNEWLQSWESYNLMKRSLDFYKLFEQYDYMLTYELDCLIFSDNWSKANSFKYDFIGAPWFKIENNSEGKTRYTNEFQAGANSGFSLRNINKCITILSSIQNIKPVWKLFSFLQLHRIIRFSWFMSYIKPLWKSGPNVWLFTLTENNPIHEDYYWTILIPKIFKFNIAPFEDALKFSFETNPFYLYHLNKELPIGCHAWEKYEPVFWTEKLRLLEE